MSWLDDVPIRITLGSLGEVTDEVELVPAPEIIVPDYLKILQETEYVFSLENKVLMGVQGGYSVLNTLHPYTPSKVAPSCPPYWMLFSSPQQSRLASRWSSDFWEPNPLRRSQSLNAAQLHALNDTVRFNISDSDNDDTSETEEDFFTRSTWNNSRLKDLDMKNVCSHCSSHLNNLPSQQGSRILQWSFQNPEARGRKIQNNDNSFSLLSGQCLTLGHHQSGLNPSMHLTPTWPFSSHATVHDSSVELLSALSPEERQLLEAVMEHGYPLRTAIIALQTTGHQSPEQILSYLVTCDRLCELGYDKAQVEEALELFQNCETKAEEFLYLFRQFHEMGFQQNAIKEVLLMHGNHRDRALEELMMHVA